jgi:hypothetical protein
MKHAYVVLTQTGTIISKGIRLYTRAPYNHSSISLSRDLRSMYSFGRKTRYNLLNNGLIEEGFDKGLFPYFPNTHCRVLEMPVADAEYEAMRSLLDRFFADRERYRYNLVGMLSIPFNLRAGREDHFFCSQFVSFVLNESAAWRRDPLVTKPMDFCEFPNARVVYEGNFQAYRNVLTGVVQPV